MYDVFDDPYCYKGTRVLKNIPGLREADALAEYENRGGHAARRRGPPRR